MIKVIGVVRDKKGRFVPGVCPPTAIKKGEHRGIAKQFSIGQVPWNKGLYGEKNHRFGTHLSEETKRKIRDSQMGEKNHSYGKKPWNYGIRYTAVSGDRNWRWRGGITTLNQVIRHCYRYRQWLSDIFTRDNFTCQECGKRGIELEAHHIKRFADIIEEYHIKTLDEAISCEELWNINNGITLCVKCHNGTKIWKKKEHI